MNTANFFVGYELNPIRIAELGDPVDDLTVATILMVVGGQLILLRPRKVSIRHSS